MFVSATTTASAIHKWLALLLAVPILFWFASGFFFALVPIERIRSEHRIVEQAPVAVYLDGAAAGLAHLARSGAGTADRIELRTLLGRPVALLTTGKARSRLYDLSDGRLLSPIPASMAVAIAAWDHAGPDRSVRVSAVTQASPEYRGALPAWRVELTGENNRSLYVSADTGMVTARRSTLWRVYDFLWSLHILDFKEHEDFNTPLLAIISALSLILLVTGIMLIPKRLGLRKLKRRKTSTPSTA